MAAAVSNAGDCISDWGTAMNDPCPPNARPNPLPGVGGVVVGSGKLGTPCVRMQRARRSIASLRVSDTGPWSGPPFGISFIHVFWADWNAGDWGLIPELAPIWTPPDEPGSGKFGTPCERMQSANLMPEASALENPGREFADDPHAASASAHPAATRAIAKCRLRVGVGSRIPAARFYLTPDNSGVTALPRGYALGLRPQVRKYRPGM